MGNCGSDEKKVEPVQKELPKVEKEITIREITKPTPDAIHIGDFSEIQELTLTIKRKGEQPQQKA